MKTRYLAILATLAFLGFSVPAIAHDCLRHTNPDHKHCVGGGGGDFTVEVFFGANEMPDGTAHNVVGQSNGNRVRLRDAPMNSLVLTSLPLPAGCNAMLGAPDGLFAISTAKIPKSSLTFTYVEANFFDFEAENVGYSLTFGPDEDGAIDDEANWLPTGVLGGDPDDSTNLTGEYLELKVQSGHGGDPDCDGVMDLDWKITVTKN
jgi:hypothetical protein